MKMGKIQASGTVQSLREKMDLPLIIQICMQPGTLGDLTAALAPLGLGEAVEADGTVLVRCPRETKMQVLSVLAGLGGKVVDLHVREPSLEDIFLGYSG